MIASDFRNEILNQIEIDDHVQNDKESEDGIDVSSEEERNNGYEADNVEERKIGRIQVQFERETATE